MSGENTSNVLKVGIDGAPAQQGAVVVNRSLDSITKTAERMCSYLDRIDQNLGEVADGMRKTGKATDDTATKFETFGEKMRNAFRQINNLPDTLKTKWEQMATPFNQTLEIVDKLKNSFAGLYEMARKAAEAQEAKESFSALAASMKADADEIIKAVNKAIGGQLSTTQIAHSTSQIMRTGVTSDMQEIAKLFQIAEFKADQTGESITAVMDQITNAIARGTPKALLPLGLMHESFAEVSDAEQLTLAKTEMLNMVLSQGSEQIARCAGETETFAFLMGELERAVTGVNPLINDTSGYSASAADKFAAMEVEVGKVSRRVGEALLPAFENIVEFIRTDILPALEDFNAYVDQLFDNADNRINRTYERQGFAGKDASIRKQISDLQKERGFAVTNFKDAQPWFKQDRANDIAKIDAQIQQLNKSLANNETARRANQIHKGVADGIKSIFSAYNQATDMAEKLTRIPTAEKHAEEKTAVVDLTKAYAEMNKIGQDFITIMSGKDVPRVISKPEEAETAFVKMTAAAGGFAVALKDGMTDAGKAAELLDKKLEKLNEIFSQAARGTAGAFGAASIGQADLSKITVQTATEMTRAISFIGGVPGGGATMSAAMGQEKITPDKAEAKKQGDDFGKVFSKSVAEALNSALTDAFKNGNMFEGLTRGITNAIQQAVSQSNPVINAGGGINFGNLGLNLGVSAVMGWLQSPGRLLGGTKINGGEVPGQAEGINQQVSNAIAARDAAQLVGASSETIGRLRGWQPAYAGYSWDESGDGFFSARTKTYQLDATAANASLAEFSKLIEKANKEMRDAEVWHIQQQAVAKIYELGGNTLTAIKLRSQDAEKRLQEIRDSLSPITGSTFATMSGLTPEQKRSLEDAQYEVASATKALSQFTDSINNANKSLVLRFPGSETQKIINAPHIDDILLGRRGANPVLTAEELALRQQITGASVPGAEPLAARASTRKGMYNGYYYASAHIGGRSDLPRPDPIVVVPPTVPLVIPATGPALPPPRGTPRAPNNGVPYAAPYIAPILDETGFVTPAQFETSRRELSKDEFAQIEAVLKEYAAAKRYTGRSMSRSRAEALSPLDALDYTGRSKRIAEHLATSEDELASIQRYLDEQAAAIFKYSAEGDIDRAKTALERWKEANNSYIAKYDEITQEQAEAMATSAEQTKYYEGLLKSSREGWTSLALNQRFLSAAGMTDAHTGLQGGTVSTGMTFYSGYSPDQIKQFAANKQLQKQAWYYGQATATETDIAIREMKARAGGDYGELEAVAKLRHDDAASRVSALSTDLTAAQTALAKTTQEQEDYLEKYNSWRAINDQFNQARLDEAQTAIDQQTAMKEKQQGYLNDILATMITRVGETQQMNGQTVLVLSGGQPDGLALANKIKDSVAGVDPELAKVIQDFIDAMPQVRWNGA